MTDRAVQPEARRYKRIGLGSVEVCIACDHLLQDGNCPSHGDLSARAASQERPQPVLLSLLADLVSFRVTNDAGECSWCEADNPARTTDHRPTCPWRRAQEIVHASR
jgi:hypothetical protein